MEKMCEWAVQRSENQFDQIQPKRIFSLKSFKTQQMSIIPLLLVPTHLQALQ